MTRALRPGERGFWLAHLADPSDPSSHLHRLLEIDHRIEDEDLRERASAMAVQLPALRRAAIAGTSEADPWIVEVDCLDEGWIQFEKGDPSETAIDACVRRPFSLSEPPLLRMHVFRADTSTTMLLVAHHLCMDGASFDSITSDLLRAVFLGSSTPVFVSSCAEGDTPCRPVDSEAWKRVLSKPPEHAVGLRSSDIGAKEVRQVQTLSATAVAALRQIRRDRGVSTATILLAAWLAALHRVLDLPDIVVAIQLDVRPPGGRALSGMYVNTLPLRSTLPQQCTWATFLEAVRGSVAQALRHRFEPFDEILDLVNPQRRADRSTVLTDFEFSSLRGWSPPDELAGSAISIVERFRPDPGTRFGLSMNVIEGKDEVHLRWTASAALYSNDDLDLLHRAVERLALDLAADAEGPAGLDIVEPAEREEILQLGAGRQAPVPLGSIAERFRLIVRQSPHQIAITHRERRHTYGELEASVASIVGWLEASGLRAGDRVLVCCSRGVEHIASILAILHLGAVYIPCDRTNPATRVARMREVVGPQAAVVDAAISPQVRAVLSGLVTLDLAEVKAPGRELSDGWRPPAPTHPAYVVFTSGSTGRPKAVEIGCEALINHLLMIEEDLGLDAGSIVAQTAPIAFDIHVWQCLSALLVGGRIVVYDERDLHDPAVFAGSIFADRITVLELVPSYLRVLAGPLEARLARHPDDQPIRCLLPTGEALTNELAGRLFDAVPGAQIFNAYGPAEAADDVTLQPLDRGVTEGPAPIGWPARNVLMAVVDRWGRLRPLGLAGELAIGGLALANGYVSEPTSEAFRPDPYRPPGRMYLTGDVCSLSSVHGFDFLGRRDDQVKVGGRRIELGEIDAAIHGIPGVVDVATVAIARDARTDLVAYVVPEPGFNVSSVRAALARSLPSSMIPSTIQALDGLPTTASGKVDRQELARRPLEQVASWPSSTHDGAAHLVREVWNRVLPSAGKLGMDDNFFALGGDSLGAAEVVARLRASGVPVGVRDLYEHQSLLAFTAAVSIALSTPSRLEEPVREAVASPRQVEMLELIADGAQVPVQATIVTGGVPEETLEAALAAVVRRRPELRVACIPRADAVWQMVVRPATDPGATPAPASVVSTPACRPAPDEVDLVRAAAASLDVQCGRQVGISTDARGRGCIALSHLVCDLVSIRNLLADLRVELGFSDARLGSDSGPSPFMQWVQETARRSHARRSDALEAYRADVRSCSRSLVAARSAAHGGTLSHWTEGPGSAMTCALARAVSMPVERADLELLAVGAVAAALTETFDTRMFRIDLDTDGRREFEDARIVGEGLGCFTLLRPLPVCLDPVDRSIEGTIDAVARALAISSTRWAWDTAPPAMRANVDRDLARVPLVNVLGEALELSLEPQLGTWTVPSCVTAWNAPADAHGMSIDVVSTVAALGRVTAIDLRFTVRRDRVDPALLGLPVRVAEALERVAEAIVRHGGRRAPDGLDLVGIPLAELDGFLAAVRRTHAGIENGGNGGE